MTDVKRAPVTAAERPTKIKILSGVTIGAGLKAAPGEIWEVSRTDAITFIGNGLAELDESEDQIDTSVGAQVVERSDRDPKPQEVEPHHKGK